MNKILLLFAFFSSQLFAYTREDVDRLKLDVTTNIIAMEGWCSVEKAMRFIDLVLEVKPKVCVELGVFGGRSIYPVGAALRFLGEGVAIAIDPWDRFECIKYFDPVKEEMNLRWWGKLNIDFIYGAFLQTLKRCDLESYVETIRKTSEEAALDIDEEIDIIHMDGNHSRLISSLDVLLYLPKVRKGGYIWMNDAGWPDRAEALELLRAVCDQAGQVDNGNCILFRKR